MGSSKSSKGYLHIQLAKVELQNIKAESQVNDLKYKWKYFKNMEIWSYKAVSKLRKSEIHINPGYGSCGSGKLINFPKFQNDMLKAILSVKIRFGSNRNKY